jgi:hypothetical protein
MSVYLVSVPYKLAWGVCNCAVAYKVNVIFC